MPLYAKFFDLKQVKQHSFLKFLFRFPKLFSEAEFILYFSGFFIYDAQIMQYQEIAIS